MDIGAYCFFIVWWVTFWNGELFSKMVKITSWKKSAVWKVPFVENCSKKRKKDQKINKQKNNLLNIFILKFFISQNVHNRRYSGKFAKYSDNQNIKSNDRFLWVKDFNLCLIELCPSSNCLSLSLSVSLIDSITQMQSDKIITWEQWIISLSSI